MIFLLIITKQFYQSVIVKQVTFNDIVIIKCKIIIYYN